MTKLDIRVALTHEDLSFQFNEFTKTRLLVLFGKIAPSGTHEKHVLHASLFGSVDQFHGDVELVLVGGGDEADGVALHLLERLDHVSDTTRLVRDDFCAELFECLTLGPSRVKRQGGDGIDLLGEIRVGEKEFSDEVAGLAVGGGDADIARHDGRY